MIEWKKRDTTFDEYLDFLTNQLAKNLGIPLETLSNKETKTMKKCYIVLQDGIYEGKEHYRGQKLAKGREEMANVEFVQEDGRPWRGPLPISMVFEEEQKAKDYWERKYGEIKMKNEDTVQISHTPPEGYEVIEPVFRRCKPGEFFEFGGNVYKASTITDGRHIPLRKKPKPLEERKLVELIGTTVRVGICTPTNFGLQAYSTNRVRIRNIRLSKDGTIVIEADTHQEPC